MCTYHKAVSSHLKDGEFCLSPCMVKDLGGKRDAQMPLAVHDLCALTSFQRVICNFEKVAMIVNIRQIAHSGFRRYIQVHCYWKGLSEV